MTALHKTPWLVRTKVNPEAALRLFCFPYAGGGATIFHSWPAKLPSHLEILSVQPPGRQGRWREEAFTRVRPMVESIRQALLPLLDKPFVFFGHSLGSVVCYELARLLRSKQDPLPQQLYLSGHRAPQLDEVRPPTFHLSDSKFRQELHRLNGTPQEVLQNPELLELMLPLLRADFEAAETYQFEPGRPLEIPFSVFGGLRDEDVPRQDLEPWSEHTRASFRLRMLPGNHFFLHSDEDDLLRLLSQDLSRLP